MTTVTLSVEQADLARKRVDAAGVASRVEVAVRDYRDQDGQFDAVVSVEMIEAVGEEFWPAYFTKVDSLLAPGGVDDDSMTWVSQWGADPVWWGAPATRRAMAMQLPVVATASAYARSPSAR